MLRFFLFITALLSLLFCMSTNSVSARQGDLTVRMALEQNPPLAGFAENGRPDGLFVDLMNEVALQNNWKVEYISCAQVECLAMIEEHRADFMAPLAWSPERAKRYNFTKSDIVTNWGVVYACPSCGINSFLELQGRKIAGVPNDIHFLRLKEQLRLFGVKADFVPYPNFDASFKAIEEGKADAAVVGRFFAMQRASLYQIEPTPIIFNPIHVHIAISPATNPELIAALDKTIEKLKADKQSVYHSSIQKHLHPVKRFVIPLWVKLVLPVTLLLLLLSILNSWNLKRVVHAKTAEIDAQYRLYRGVFDNVLHMQGVLSPDGILLHVNRKALEFAGVKEGDVVGKKFWETPWWGHSDKCRDKLFTLIEKSSSGEVLSMDTTHINAAGELRAIHFSLIPLLDEQGRVLYLIAQGRDRTERHYFEQELNSRNAFMNTFFNSIPFELWVRDCKGRLVMQNHLHEEHYGEDLGTTIADCRLDQMVKNAWQINLEEAIRGETIDIEEREGPKIYRKIIAPIIEQDTVTACLGLNIDITERYKMLQQVMESERRFKMLFDELPFIVTIKEPNSAEYINVNRFYCEFNNVEKADVIGKRPPEIGMFIDKEQHRSIKQELEKSGRVDLKEIIINRHDGSKRTGLLSCRLVTLAGIPSNLTVIQDITELKEAELALRKAKEREQSLMLQNEKMLMIGGMAAGMAHEINNPAGIIAQELQNLKRRLSPSLPANRAVAEQLKVDIEGINSYLQLREIPDFIEHIDEGVRRISTIVNNMLQFSRQDIKIQLVSDIEYIINHSLDLAGSDYDLRNHYDFKGISVTIETEKNLPPVWVIVTEIEQVLINLIKNAAQSLYGFIEDRRISIITTRNNDWITLKIRDNGPGIPEELQSRIFEPFFTTKDVGMGTGLGLAISYAIVSDHHKGRLEVSSTLGTGTCFTVWLPISKEIQL